VLLKRCVSTETVETTEENLTQVFTKRSFMLLQEDHFLGTGKSSSMQFVEI